MTGRLPGLPRLDRVDRQLIRRIATIGILTFLVGYAVTAGLFIVTGNRADVVTVPDVRRLAADRAERQLRRADLFMEVADSLPNGRIPQGAVLTQSPLPGREVAPETPVKVILSRGPQRVTIPRITMYPPDQAERILGASGLRVSVQTVPDLAARGRVIGTVPAAGSAVMVSGPVRLLVSAGPPTVSVPTVIGLAEADARALLRSTSLRVGGEERVFRPDVPAGTVLSQIPMPGDSTLAGTRVRLQIATAELVVEAPDTATAAPTPPSEPGGAP